MNEFIRLGQLYEFTVEITKTIIEEKIRNRRWEYYIHKVDGMTFDEYVALCEQENAKTATDQEIVEAIDSSNDMLNGFVPN